MRPILLSSCARATTWEEARYRIDAPVAGRRGSRVVALDDGAATLARRLAHEPWSGARFYTLAAHPEPPQGEPDDMPLHRTNGAAVRLAGELAEADVVVLVATRGGASAAAVATIGRACARRGIMTAGVVLGARDAVADTVLALRPYAQVLLVSRDESDVAELLTAIRA
jgi:hypothetical protein